MDAKNKHNKELKFNDGNVLKWIELTNGINFIDGSLFVRGIPDPNTTKPKLKFNGKIYIPKKK